MAAWTLGRSARTEEEREGAGGWLCHVLEQYPRDEPLRRLARSYRRTAVGLAILFALAGLIRGAPIPIFLLGALFGAAVAAVPLCLPFYPLSATVDRARLKRVRATAARSMGLLARPELAGALAKAYGDSKRLVREAAALWFDVDSSQAKARAR